MSEYRKIKKYEDSALHEIQRDTVTNWYNKVPKNIQNHIKEDKNFNKHLIKPESLIVIAGPSGAGKSNWLVEFLSRKIGSFYEIILFSGSFTDEPIYQYLLEQIPDMQLIDDIDEMPRLEDFTDEDKVERLLIFDDTVKLTAKQQNEIERWFMAGRKLGFTICYLTQKFLGNGGCPIFIRQQMNYLILFRLNDNSEAKQILKKYNMGLNINTLFKIYEKDTKEKGQFLTFDLRSGKIRQNMIGKIN